jgi:hypothetical protein
MSPKEIKSYTMRWNLMQHSGQIVLQLADNATRSIPMTDPAEFAAVAAILNQSPVFLLPETNEITTKWEPIEGN